MNDPPKESALSKMTKEMTYKILAGLVIIAPLAVGYAYFQGNNGPPEGTWACTSEWSNAREGVTVPCSSEMKVTCTDNLMSTIGVVSIGEAQWSEKKEGTCYSSGEELYGNWTSVQTVPTNDAARQFEQDRLGGESLAIATNAVEHEHRVRVTSRTDSELRAVNKAGRVISCNSL